MSNTTFNGRYLSIQEQKEVISKFRVLQESLPLKEKLFVSYGEVLSGSALFASSLVFWRAGFRGFNLYRYGKGRISTLFLATTTCFSGAVAHTMFVKERLTTFNRREDMLHYGLRALAIHQYGLMATFVSSLGGTFLIAYKAGIIPIPEPMYREGNRQVAINYFITKLKPYSKGMLYTCFASSTIMFLVGMLEYKQSGQILSKLNKRSLVLRE